MFSILFNRLLRRNAPKPEPVKEVQYTGGNEFMSVDLASIRKQLAKKLWDHTYKKVPLSHTDLQACARFLFDVKDMPSTLWRLRYSPDSLLYFKLSHLQPVFNKKNPTQLYLVFIDDSMGSSMHLQIEIRELWEMMEPVAPLDLDSLTNPKKTQV